MRLPRGRATRTAANRRLTAIITVPTGAWAIVDVDVTAAAMIEANAAIVVFIQPAPGFHLVFDLEINSTTISMFGATTGPCYAGTAAFRRDDGDGAKLFANLRKALLND